jgi:predicted GIY-YIG superfamily endonuclease
MHLPYCVYILFSEVDHLLYIGFTTNLEERIKRHNSVEIKVLLQGDR